LQGTQGIESASGGLTEETETDARGSVISVYSCSIFLSVVRSERKGWQKNPGQKDRQLPANVSRPFFCPGFFCLICRDANRAATIDSQASCDSAPAKSSRPAKKQTVSGTKTGTEERGEPRIDANEREYKRFGAGAKLLPDRHLRRLPSCFNLRLFVPPQADFVKLSIRG
jgi:hypothetical protein